MNNQQFKTLVSIYYLSYVPPCTFIKLSVRFSSFCGIVLQSSVVTENLTNTYDVNTASGPGHCHILSRDPAHA